MGVGDSEVQTTMYKIRDFPGGPLVRTPRSHCRGHRFDPWSGNYDPTCYAAWPKDKN